MDTKSNIEKALINLKLEILSCKQERWSEKKSFYETVLRFYLEEQELLKLLQEKQKKLHIIENQILLKTHNQSSSQKLLSGMKDSLKFMEEDLKLLDEWEIEIKKKIEQTKKLLEESEKELLQTEKEKDKLF